MLEERMTGLELSKKLSDNMSVTNVHYHIVKNKEDNNNKG